MRRVRVRAARTGRRDADVLEEVLREGLGVIDRIRAKTSLDEDEAQALAHDLVHGQRVGTVKRSRS